MNILALEFSSPQRSVAIVGSDYKVLAVVSEQHGKMTGASMVETALALGSLEPKDIDRVAVGLGPGSHAGVRAAIAIAQGWAIGRDLPVAGVSSVEVLVEDARLAGRRGDVRLVIDAQRGEVCTAVYRIGDKFVQGVEELHIVRPAAWSNVLGPEASKLVTGAEDLFPSAASLARLARGRESKPPEELQPIYLRENAFVKAPPPRNY